MRSKPASDPSFEAGATEPVEVGHDGIAARAHELYLARGAAAGSALEDWLQAESEIVGVRSSGEVPVG